jgi:hypothetical protein
MSYLFIPSLFHKIISGPSHESCLSSTFDSDSEISQNRRHYFSTYLEFKVFFALSDLSWDFNWIWTRYKIDSEFSRRWRQNSVTFWTESGDDQAKMATVEQSVLLLIEVHVIANPCASPLAVQLLVIVSRRFCEGGWSSLSEGKGVGVWLHSTLVNHPQLFLCSKALLFVCWYFISSISKANKKYIGVFTHSILPVGLHEIHPHGVTYPSKQMPILKQYYLPLWNPQTAICSNSIN